MSKNDVFFCDDCGHLLNFDKTVKIFICPYCGARFIYKPHWKHSDNVKQ